MNQELHLKKTLRLILGDQLNCQHSWFNQAEEHITYVMMEVQSESSYTVHHIQKVVAFFAAMRSFSLSLQSHNHSVIYYHFNDHNNLHSFEKNINYLIEKHQFEHFEYQFPDEYRLDEMMKEIASKLNISSNAVDSEHFMSERNELGDFFKGKKTFLMESFYRSMRKKYHLLMQGDQPLTGKWNYDSENRKKLPNQHKPIAPLLFSNDVSTILQEINSAGIKTIGKIEGNELLWPINREQSLALLDFFVLECLPLFGTYQDAMMMNEWSLYHSRLSFSMNTKMITPLEVVQKAIDTWELHPDKIEINQLEGFVRQIIGWREYMRGIYWSHMPDYAKMNFLENQEQLPEWFWTGKTKMSCLKDAINQSLNFAYAHHIQRLMITGNFALLAGVNPDLVDAWYLGIYIDAIEWVEITNTRGMSQFADGGIVGTKPYVSSAAYIDKMSHYCKGCYYDKAVKTGDKACPFNSLYWNFYDKNSDKLSNNPRIGMMYNVWNKMKPEAREGLLKQAKFYLENIHDL